MDSVDESGNQAEMKTERMNLLDGWHLDRLGMEVTIESRESYL